MAQDGAELLVVMTTVGLSSVVSLLFFYRQNSFYILSLPTAHVTSNLYVGCHRCYRLLQDDTENFLFI